MAAPRNEPLGLRVIGTGQLVGRELDQALAAAGASRQEWLVLVALKGRRHGAQHDLAAAGDERVALDALAARGWVAGGAPTHDGSGPAGQLTAAGDQAFNGLLKAVVGFDRRLRSGLTDEEIATLDGLLARLAAGLTDSSPGDPPVADPGPSPGGHEGAPPHHVRPEHG
jgi:MarR family transcriptional regulator for hemolysin